MQKEFKGKNVVVTGAGHGTGRKAALRFGASEAHVFALEYHEGRLGNLIKEMTQAGMKVTPIKAEVGNPEQWKGELPKEIDVLCNIVGLIDPAIDPKADPDDPDSKRPDVKVAIEWAKGPDLDRLTGDLQLVFDTNYFGHHILSLVAAGKMIEKRRSDKPATTRKKKKKRWGVIINVGSTNVFTLNERRLAYVPAKAALHAETLLMAKVLAPYGIRVNCVATGAIAETLTVSNEKDAEKSIPLGINYAKDVVNAIEFLASKNASQVTGALLIVDGGRTVAAG